MSKHWGNDPLTNSSFSSMLEMLSAAGALNVIFIREIVITISHIQTVSRASAADYFWKHYGKWRNSSKEKFLLLSHCFQYCFQSRLLLLHCSMREKIKPFPTCRCFVTPHNEQFLLLPQCFQFYSMIFLSFIGNFNIF